MTKNTVQNQEANVENQTLIEKVKDKVVKEASQNIFNSMINLHDMSHIIENVTTKLAIELKKDLLFPKGLDLTEEEKETLSCTIQIIVQNSKDEYLENINKDKRTENIANLVQENLEIIPDRLLSSIAKEINRGVLINAQAVAASSKSEKYNTIELHHGKNSGDITVPASTLLLSSNVVDIIKRSVEIDEEVGGEDE